jgi:hypothetical protein
MKWIEQGYFKGENAVSVRMIKQTEQSILEDNEFVSSDTIDFTKYL